MKLFFQQSHLIRMRIVIRFSFFLISLFLLSAGCARQSSVTGALLVTVEGNLPAPQTESGFLPRHLSPVSPSLLPSAASALTGLYPPEHGLRIDGVGKLDTATETIATRFSQKGYDCAAFLSTVALSPIHGLSRGFSPYIATLAPTNRAYGFVKTTGQVVEEASAWLSKRTDKKPVFLWIHISPYAGIARTDREAMAAAGKTAAESISTLIRRFSKTSPVLVLPLYGLGADVDFRGLTLSDPEFRPTAWCRALPHNPNGIADVPYSFGVADKAPSFHYTESLIPWYAFRLPPLQRLSDSSADISALQGLAPVRPQTLARQQEEALVLQLQGHLGEGLIPPYTNGAPRLELGTNELARVNRARRHLLQPETNRLASARALVASDPEVPLFHHWLGEEYLKNRDYMQAANAFAKEVDLGYNMVQASRLLSRCHLEIGNIPAAVDQAENAFLANETDPLPRHELVQLLLRLSATLREKGELKSANDCLSRCFLLAPRSVPVICESARLQAASGDTEQAIATLQALLKKVPGNKAATTLLNTLQKAPDHEHNGTE